MSPSRRSTRWNSRAHDELEQRVLERTAELEQANARLHAEVAERQRAEQELLSTAAGTGPNFFDSLVREFAKTIGVRYALVAEHLDAPVTRVRTLAVWADGQPGENFEYDVQGTPCDDVTQGLTRFYATGVCPLFPDDEMLVDMTAEGYCGILSPVLQDNRSVISSGSMCGP
jgi:hypothetical protein